MDLIGIAGSTAVVAGGMAGAAYIARGAWRATRRVHHLSDDLLGDPDAGKPGVVLRLDGIDRRLARFDVRLHGVEAQLSPNGRAGIPHVPASVGVGGSDE